MASTISKMTTAQVAALTTTQIAGLQSTDVAALTAAMIDAMDLNPTDGQFEAFKPTQITSLSNLAVAALSSTQLNQLTTATFAALSKTQVAAISTAAISGIDVAHIKALSSVQITGLSISEIANLTTAQVSQLSTAAVGALSTAQLGAFLDPLNKSSGADVTGGIAALTPTQFAALSSTALPGLETNDINIKGDAANSWLGVTTAQLAALTSKQAPGLASDDLGEFAAAQINALNTAAFSQLTKTQIAAIDTAQISGLDASHLGALTTAQASGLSVGAMGKLSAAQLASLPSDVVGVLTAAQLGGLANGVIKGFTADQFASLASSALPGLDAADITSLNDNSVVSNTLLGALTSKQTPGLATADIALFSAAQINLLDPDAFAALSKTQVAAIAIDQIESIDANHIAALTSAQVSGLSTAAISALNDGTVTGQIAALSTAAVAALSAAQVDALGADGVAALTSDQFAALPSKALAGLTAGDITSFSDNSFTPTAYTTNAPTLVSSTPINGATAFAAGDNITLTFSEDVEFGTGNINVKTGATDMKFAVATGTSATGTVTVEGNTVTINPLNTLVGSSTYNVIIDDTAILDMSGTAFDGSATGDVTFDVAPMVSSAKWTGNPANNVDDSTTFPVNDSITLTFAENMKAGVGNIIISSTDGSDVRTIPVSDTSQVTAGTIAVPAATVIINPTANLNAGTGYFVQMASGTLVDAAVGAPYAGISDQTTLNFTTATDAVIPAPTLIVNTAASTDTNLVLQFGEDVTPVAGKTIQIIRTTGAVQVGSSIDVATDPQVSITGRYVTINPTDALPAADTYYLLMDAGAFKDSSGNVSAAVTLPATLSTGALTAITDTTFASQTPTLTPLDDEAVDATPIASINLDLLFTEKVMPGAGNITIRSDDGSDIRVINIHDSTQVDFTTTPMKVTINPLADLRTNTLYSVQVDGGAITDFANNSYNGISNTTGWNFTTIDALPSIVSSSPADNATATTATPVALDSNIVLVFNEPVKANPVAKNITLEATVNGAATNTTIATNSSQVSIDGNVVTINPTTDLTSNAIYELYMEADTFIDVDGAANNTAAIANGSGIDFFTTDTIAPQLGFVNGAPVRVGFTPGGADTFIGMVFDEVVAKGSGNIIINGVVTFTGAPVATQIVPVSTVTVDAANKAIAIPVTALAGTNKYSITMDSGVIVDVDGNSYIPGASMSGAPALTKIGGDTTAPLSISTALAADITAGFSGTAEGNNFTLQFNEAVKAGNGDIIISDGAGDTRVISAADTSQVYFNATAKTAIINPTFDLAPNVAYSVTIGSGAITDLQGNAYNAPTAVTQGLSVDRIALLTSAQIPGLSVDAITAMSSTQVLALTPEAVGAMSSAQIAALDPNDVANMTVEQFAAIGSAAIAGLEASDITALASIPGATDRIAALTATQAPKLSEAVMTALNTVQAPALSVDAVGALTSVQLNAMTPSAIGSMTFAQFAALNSAALASLDATDIDALDASNTGQIAAITVDQIAKISTDAIASFNSTQISALATETFAALSTAQIEAIDIGAVAGITAAQIEALTCAHQNLTQAQVLLLNAAQLQAMNFATPLVLDLNGDNVIDTTAAKDGVVFDLAGDGSATQVGWVAPSDGLLVLDVNGDGVINDGTELFGSGTRLADGSTAADGFIALAALNSNNKDASEGVIDAQDAAFAQLQVWQDANQDGVTDAGELLSLAELNIASLSLDANRDTREMNNGNILDMYAEYTTTDGATHQLVDVLLAGVIDAP
ncbi:beta strand repeat-containing protein [Chromatium okenii]|uniref:SbsA Ig-like domain-containing protein n=1 Tax=Chromatium okenii TaxID=61644 RepID=A0A2S7XPP1_9GAMM|nr:Ig-like domain-containing protein [Chromatium okenii]PQJ95523.1 hypothetical protein CXB77_15305 [Chromatium okenii]